MSLKQRIAEELELNSLWIDRIIARAPHAYKTYSVKKKRGGYRTIAQPARETKAVQYWLISNLFNTLPVHEAATAYKQGASIVDNADRHKDNSYLAKFDFLGFFTSIKGEMLASFLKAQFPDFDEDDLNLIVRVCCIRNRQTKSLHLSIGAPTSPILSNVMLYRFDSILGEVCRHLGVTYTRYADDITFSSNNKDQIRGIETILRDVIRQTPDLNLRINNQKTIFLSKKHSRRITGVVISNDGRLSLGREKKRLIRSMVDHYIKGKLSEEQKGQLQGQLGHAKNVDPLFVSRLRGKYGSKVIDGIIRQRAGK